MTPVICSAQIQSIYPQCSSNQQPKVGKCELKLDGFPGNRAIVNVDCVMPSKAPGSRCDYVIVADENGEAFFLPVEFKKSSSDFVRIKRQLEGGIKFFEEHLPNGYRCYPVFVSRGLGPGERRKLQQITVQGQDKKIRIKHVRCNDALRWDVVKKGS